MIYPPMLLYAERLAWSGLAAMGLLFLSLSLRLREDREFGLLGSSLSLICLVFAPDIWTPRAADNPLDGIWMAVLQDAEQIAACAYAWVAMRFAQVLTGRPGPRVLRIHTAILAAFCIGFYIDALSPAPFLIVPLPGDYRTGPAYDWTFAPYLMTLYLWIVGLTIRGWRKAEGEARRTLGALSIAYALLAMGGIGDFCNMLFPGSLPVPSCSVIGALAMGAIGIYLFTAKLIRLYDNQRDTLLKIAEIRGDLEVQGPLGALGRSAAHITESIRGYVAEIKADADSLRLRPETAARAEMARIESVRRRLETFTSGILEFSRSARTGERRLLAPYALAAECLMGLTASERALVRVSGTAARPIQADPVQLRRAVIELVRNALQAGAGRVEIRLTEGLGRLSLAVEDDGTGFPADGLDRICEPFFTTHKAEGACGLGAATAQGILRAHGGSLAYYPAAARSGLLANAVLPQAGAESRWDQGGPGWILICDEATRISRFLAVCANVGIAPAVRASREAGAPYPASGSGIALVDAALGPMASLPARWERFRLAGDAAGGDGGRSSAGDPADGPGSDAAGGPAWLREESLIALAAAAPLGVAWE
jgi:signal transduction histidine kinase